MCIVRNLRVMDEDSDFQSLHDKYVRNHGKILNLDNLTEPIPKKILNQKMPDVTQFTKDSKALNDATRRIFKKL